MKNKKIFYVVMFIIIFCYAFYILSSRLQNDTFYTVKVGELIVKNGIDFKDHFSFHSLSYIYPHFLFDVVVYLVYRLAAWHGVYFLVVFITSVIAFLFFNELYSSSKLPFFSCIVTFYMVNFLGSCFTARAQLFSYLFLLIEYLALSRYTKTLNRKYLYILPIISCLIANSHCAVIMMFYVLFLPYLVSYIVSFKCKWRFDNLISDFKSYDNGYIKWLVIIVVISTLTAFINPLGVDAFMYTPKILMGNTMQSIQEHLPTTIVSYLPLYLFLFIVLVSNQIFKLKYRISDFCFLLGFFLMAFMGNRHVAYVMIFGFLIFFSSFFASFKGGTIKKYDDFFLRIIRRFVCLLIPVVMIMLFRKWPLIGERTIQKSEYPVDASTYILENIDLSRARIFNNYDFGSYLLYRGIPVFIDSRCDLYTKEFNGKVDIFADYEKIKDTLDQDLIIKYAFTHALLYKNDNDYKRFTLNYNLIYEDDYFGLFVISDILNEKE